jgi:uncharacterized protein (TIGR03000 family)
MLRCSTRMQRFRRFASSLGKTSLASAAVFMGLSIPSAAHAQIGDRNSGPGVVVCPGGCYGGAHPFGCRGYGGPGYYGFFRRYWAYGFYGPNYHLYDGSGLGQTFTQFAMVYGPSQGGPGVFPGPEALATVPTDGAEAADGSVKTPPEQAQPETASTEGPKLPDNAAQLLLVVPENAEVLFNGEKMNRSGPVREFVTPSLEPGKTFTYEVVVQSADAKGKPVSDKRTVRVRANDRYRLDFTRPAPEKLPGPKPEKTGPPKR